MTDYNTYQSLLKKAKSEYLVDGVVHSDTLARASDAGITPSTLMQDVRG